MSEQVKIAKAAGVVGAATLASRVMGYIRDMVMSWAFGTGMAADAFYVAYRIPNLLRELLAEGSMSAAFIPVFTETLTKESRESALHLANAVFARLLVILIVLVGVAIVFCSFIFSSSPLRHQDTNISFFVFIMINSISIFRKYIFSYRIQILFLFLFYYSSFVLLFFLKITLIGDWSKPNASLIRLVRKRLYEK